MNRNSTNSALKALGLMLWTFTPCAALWVGLYHLKSGVWTYALYHGLCLVPAIIWGKSLWRPTLSLPVFKHFLQLLLAAAVFSAGAVGGYEIFGHKVLANEHIAVLLKEQGVTQLFVLFAFWATLVNPLLEEIFWRGVVLNELERLVHVKYFGIIWSSLTYALFHYLVFRLVLYPGYAELGTLLLAGYGALMAVIYRRTGSILTTALAHGLLTDLACIVLILDYFRKFGYG